MRFRIPEIVLGFLLGTACFSLIAATQLIPLAIRSTDGIAQENSAPCVSNFLGICFVSPSTSPQQTVFGFAQFLTAFALLMVAYTLSEVRYRFRVAVAPIPLIRLTFVLSGFIGVATLVSNIWFVERWPTPKVLADEAILQGVLGLLFFALALTWIWVAFVRPPRFGRGNCQKFAQELYLRLLQGVENELPTIASELARSAQSIVKWAREIGTGPVYGVIAGRDRVSRSATDILLMIGNRKFCRHVVANAPGTAMAFLGATVDARKYNLPLSQFARNVSNEALLNKDSMLYHEDHGYYSGFFGYVRPFSSMLYGNYELVEALGSNGSSPLDLDLKTKWSLDAEQVEAYCRAIKIPFEGYLDSGHWGQHSFALYRAFGDVQRSCSDLYKLNKLEDFYNSDTAERLNAVVTFVEEMLAVLDGRHGLRTVLRRRGNRRQVYGDFYDYLADLMFEIISDASTVTGPTWTCWSIQHNAVWARYFSFAQGTARKIIQFKLRRLLYDEVRRLSDFPNFKSARILGYCLNVMGVTLERNDAISKQYLALHRVILNWTRRNYVRLRRVQPNVAAACLVDSMSFDEAGNRLVKTYPKHLNLEEPKVYLELDPPA